MINHPIDQFPNSDSQLIKPFSDKLFGGSFKNCKKGIGFCYWDFVRSSLQDSLPIRLNRISSPLMEVGNAITDKLIDKIKEEDKVKWLDIGDVVVGPANVTFHWRTHWQCQVPTPTGERETTNTSIKALYGVNLEYK